MNAVVEYSSSEAIENVIAADVLAGLHRKPKEISSTWLYDNLGSRLFDAICELPEYYPTRTELKIMCLYAHEMARRIGPGAAVIEFGSGSSYKSRLLLDQLISPDVYVPVDISRQHLLDAASSVARDYPWLRVIPLCADFTHLSRLPERALLTQRRVVYFPGSTLGNFQADTAVELLTSIRELIGTRGAALIGIDLRKNVTTMERAYNDAQGLTAKFNLNVLRHLNRELQSDFCVDAFEHSAVWVDKQDRIEMRLISKKPQRVHLGGDTISFEAGEYIVTEHSHKYTLASFEALANSAGLDVQRVWCDPCDMFSVQLLESR
jgi:L-histidine N-alpha-methyltransferase